MVLSIFSEICLKQVHSLVNLLPFYRAFIFFSSSVSKDLVAQIKRDASVLPRIGALSEVKSLIFMLLTVLLHSYSSTALCLFV